MGCQVTCEISANGLVPEKLKKEPAPKKPCVLALAFVFEKATKKGDCGIRF